MVLHQVSQQLEKGIQLADVQISLGLTELTVMHAEWLLGQTFLNLWSDFDSKSFSMGLLSQKSEF